jgi:Zn-dependent protease
MKWSWRIGRIAGIDISVHATFLLLLAWYALVAWRDTGSVAAASVAVLFVLAVFASVVAHEYGHALTARRYGIPTRGITLLPIGGVAQLDHMPDEPRQELVIAVAGPLVTVAIVVVLYLVLLVSGRPLAPDAAMLPRTAPQFLAQLMWVNVTLAVFNLLPAFPMDGGRMLRAFLAMRSGDYVRATERAANVGKAFALLFGIWGLFIAGNPFLVLIALFVWMGAAGEAAATQTRDVFHDIPVSRVMITDVRTLHPTDTLGKAVEHILGGFQQDFPVVDGDRVVGVLTRSALLKALAEKGTDAWVTAAMDREFKTADPEEGVAGALARLQECKCHTLPVVRDGELVGVFTTENVGEYLMIDAAMRGRRR